MKTSTLWSVLVATAALTVGGSAFAQDSKPAQPPKETPKAHPEAPKADKPHADKPHADKPHADKPADAKKDAVEPGQAAPDFKIKDTDGKEHSLADSLKAGHLVVLQWFNPDCPFVQKHYTDAKTFNDLYAKYNAKGVDFYAVNSGAPGNEGSGIKRNAEAKKTWNIPYAILLDETGETGRAYNAKNTPLMVVIGKDGKVAYWGAIDDEPAPGKTGKTNYVAKALDELLAGSNVTMPKTKPYGCAVKYGKSKN